MQNNIDKLKVISNRWKDLINDMNQIMNFAVVSAVCFAACSLLAGFMLVHPLFIRTPYMGTVVGWLIILFTFGMYFLIHSIIRFITIKNRHHGKVNNRQTQKTVQTA